MSHFCFRCPFCEECYFCLGEIGAHCLCEEPTADMYALEVEAALGQKQP